ncbi:hypothetical protein BGW80DRAFT_453937 [Lactifluus volemus]|nr:hypothetical protein BGW80DRAFT_453937 [Lactifluus volemus]
MFVTLSHKLNRHLPLLNPTGHNLDTHIACPHRCPPPSKDCIFDILPCRILAECLTLMARHFPFLPNIHRILHSRCRGPFHVVLPFYTHHTRGSAGSAQSISRRTHGKVTHFGDMATFFGLCVWLAPLFLFLSLSANDNTLPTSDTVSSPSVDFFSVSAQRSRSSLFRSMFGSVPGIRRSSRSPDDSAALSLSDITPPSHAHALTLISLSPTRSGTYGDVPEPASAGLQPELSLNRVPPRRASPVSSSVLTPRKRGSDM